MNEDAAGITSKWGRVAVVALAMGVGSFVGAGMGNARVEAGASPAATAAIAPVQASSYADLVARVAPSIVTVRSERVAKASPAGLPIDPEQFFKFFGDRGPAMPEIPQRQAGLGSGVVVNADGTILTNHHVIDGAEKIQVELADRRIFTAKLVGSDPASDLAVIKIDAKGLAVLPFGDSGKTRVGDVVLAFGNPLGVGQTVTMGIVSAKGRATGLGDGSFEDFLQTDAPINQGNSGGALVNTGAASWWASTRRSCRPRGATSASASRFPPRWRATSWRSSSTTARSGAASSASSCRASAPTSRRAWASPRWRARS